MGGASFGVSGGTIRARLASLGGGAKDQPGLPLAETPLRTAAPPDVPDAEDEARAPLFGGACELATCPEEFVAAPLVPADLHFSAACSKRYISRQRVTRRLAMSAMS